MKRKGIVKTKLTGEECRVATKPNGRDTIAIRQSTIKNRKFADGPICRA